MSHHVTGELAAAPCGRVERLHVVRRCSPRDSAVVRADPARTWSAAASGGGRYGEQARGSARTINGRARSAGPDFT